MSASTEIPDVIGGITNAIGLNRLWQTDEQADAEKRKAEQTEESVEDERDRTRQDEKPDESLNVAPVSIEQKKNKEIDQDAAIHGVVRQPNPPTGEEGKGYEWPGPAAPKDNLAKTQSALEPTQNEKTESPRDEDQQPTKDDEQPSKVSFMGTLIPFLTQQKTSSPTPPTSTTGESRPHDKENASNRPRRHSSSNLEFQRPKVQRQYTMPAPATESLESSRAKSVARSRWQAAAQSLRIPLRRRRHENNIAKTRGAELISTLAAGAPAANILASHMVLDERSRHRIPIVVDLLKVPARLIIC
jgi:hypothetical protein